MAKRTNDLSELSRLLSGDEEQHIRRDVAASSGEEDNTGGSEGDRAAALCKLHVQLEKKGRRGKGVTVVKGFFHTKEDLQTFARELKTRCGSGGTAKSDSIEIQGDHRATVADYFRSKGFRVTGV
ncbi:MAG: translation initiation factor [Bacteroidetes bacterium]|nr:translation initiation factor [Bacteroidota bacterium]